MGIIKEQINKTEGSKTFKRLTNNIEFFCVIYDSDLNIILLNEVDKPNKENLVVDSMYTGFAASTHKQLIEEAKRRKLKILK